MVLLPADISTNAENNAISSSVRCIEHKLFPNSNTKLIKSSHPAKMKIETLYDNDSYLQSKRWKEVKRNPLAEDQSG